MDVCLVLGHCGKHGGTASAHGFAADQKRRIRLADFTKNFGPAREQHRHPVGATAFSVLAPFGHIGELESRHTYICCGEAVSDGVHIGGVHGRTGTMGEYDRCPRDVGAVDQHGLAPSRAG